MMKKAHKGAALLICCLTAAHACVPESWFSHFKLGADSISAASLPDTTATEKKFLTVPNNASARASLEFITSKSHVAGS